MQLDSARAHPLWPLPLAAGALPLFATVIAYALAIRLELAPACNPFLEGCVSISRAARHDLPNILFRALMLPAAVLQIACWLLCPAWLRSIDAKPDGWLRALPWLGVGAGIALILYGAFLGTEGVGYRLLRRYGTTLYFGFTCIAMLLVARGMRRLSHAVTRLLTALCMALPLLGLVHVVLPIALAGENARNAVQNATEWWGGAIFTLFFFVLAWAWRVTAFRARFGRG